jgi:hypothetical protein
MCLQGRFVSAYLRPTYCCCPCVYFRVWCTFAPELVLLGVCVCLCVYTNTLIPKPFLLAFVCVYVCTTRCVILLHHTSIRTADRLHIGRPVRWVDAETSISYFNCFPSQMGSRPEGSNKHTPLDVLQSHQHCIIGIQNKPLIYWLRDLLITWWSTD